jgi:hypothetical protein
MVGGEHGSLSFMGAEGDPLTRGLLLARKIQRFRFNDLRDSYFLAQKCVFKEKRAPRAAMEPIRQTQKGPPGEPVGP